MSHIEDFAYKVRKFTRYLYRTMITSTQLACQKDRFQLSPDVTYLNGAYMSPLLKSVEEAGIVGLRKKRTPSQLGHQEFFEDVDEVRRLFATIIHASDYQRIAILPSVSYGIAIVAKNLRLSAGDNVVVVGEQFPSNIYGWQKLAAQNEAQLKTVTAPDTSGERGKQWNERLLAAIDARTKLVAVPHVHWSDGTRFDLVALRQRTRAVGSWLVIDGTQSVGAFPFNVHEIQPEALICAGYKWLMGPYGTTLGYFGEAFDEGEPLDEGWCNRYGSEDFANLVHYQDRYQPGALRYDMGERSNFISIPMMGQALREIAGWGVENIQAYCETLVTPFVERLSDTDYRFESPAYRGNHLFGLRLPPGIHLTQLQRLLDEARISVSIRGNSVRISPHVYNEPADLERLTNCLRVVGT